MSQIDKPNLLIAGFQKCASTSLYDLLTSHDEILGSTPKETYFLCDNPDGFVPHRLMAKKWSDLFIQKDNRCQKYYLEATVANFYQEKAIAYAQDNNCKVIFIVRDPIDRLLSVYNYQKHNFILSESGDTTLADFISNAKNGFYTHEFLKNALEHGKYYKYIERWKLEVGSENVFVLGLKDILNGEIIELNELFDFLSLEVPTNSKIKFRNVSMQPANLKAHKLLLSVFGGKKIPFKKQIIKAYKNKYFNKAKKPMLELSLKLDLQQYYSEEYEQLKKYF